MDPTENEMRPKAQLHVARLLFFAGFALLPWLWLANYFLFRPYLQRKSTPPHVIWYATRSLWLGLLGSVLLVLWYAGWLGLRHTALGALTFLHPTS